MKNSKIAKELKSHEKKGKKNMARWMKAEKSLAREDDKMIKQLKKKKK